MNNEIKNILVIRTDRFGEFILTLPAIHALKEKFPSSRLTLMAHPYSAQLISGSSDIDDIIEYEDADFTSLSSIWKLSRKLRSRKFDLAVIFNPKREFNIVTFLAGIPIRLGYDRKWGFLLNKRLKDLKFLGSKHEVEYNLDLVRSLGIETGERIFSIPVSEGDLSYIGRIISDLGLDNLNNLIAVHPWTSDPIKQWPPENFLQLSQRLSRDFSCKVIIIGGKEEIGRSQKFCAGKTDLVDLTGKLTLKQLAAFFPRCRCLVSNDSGPIHLASAVGTPVIALFRNDIPGKTAKRWTPWGREHIVIEKDNLNKITAEEVLDKVKILLGR